MSLKKKIPNRCSPFTWPPLQSLFFAFSCLEYCWCLLTIALEKIDVWPQRDFVGYPNALLSSSVKCYMIYVSLWELLVVRYSGWHPVVTQQNASWASFSQYNRLGVFLHPWRQFFFSFHIITSPKAFFSLSGYFILHSYIFNVYYLHSILFI